MKKLIPILLIAMLFFSCNRVLLNPFEFKIDERNKRFGTHCLMIKDLPRFFDLIQYEFKRNGFDFKHGFVEYYDKNSVSKDLNIFDKSLEFEYQKEFRFYVENDKIEPIKDHVGSLMDISEMFMIQDIEQLKILPAF